MKKLVHKLTPIKKLSLILTVSVFNMVLLNTYNNVYANTETLKLSVKNDWEKEGGIKVLSIRRTAAGYMLDFRYKVIDPDKAAVFLDRSNKPYMNVLKNGSKLVIPVTSKIGPLRQSANVAKAGKNYFMFFANPGRMVKAGDKVQINLGELESKVLIVE